MSVAGSREAEVPIAIAQLQEQMNLLEKQVGQLESRLQPVLALDHAKNPVPPPGISPKTPLISQRIRGFSEDLQRIIDHLKTVEGALEI